MAQALEFAVIHPGGGVIGVLADAPGGMSLESSAVATFDIVCSCEEPHALREEGDTGCGWGRGLVVQLERPKQA